MGRRLPRSYLYVPALAGDKLAKAVVRGADALVVDLEDAVPVDRKAEGRAAAGAWLANLEDVDLGSGEIWARVNAGEVGEEDLAALPLSVLTGICVPKVSGPGDLSALQARLKERQTGQPPGPLWLQPLIETAQGVLAAERIARVAGVRRLQLGEVDLGAELGIDRGGDESEFLLARSQLVLASAAAGIDPPVAPVSVDFGDVEAFAASTRALKRLGYRGRACIHPAQVKVANEVFTPSGADLERARSLVRGSELAAAAGSGVWRDAHGAMADEAVVRAARRLLEEQGPYPGT
jgi:citrate lyase subunit beta/citryl-CoA lyase